MHKVCRLPQVPRTLCLIEDDNVLRRRAGIDKRIIPKVLHVLDESLYTLADFPLPHLLALSKA